MSALHVVGFQTEFSHGNQLFGWSSSFGFWRWLVNISCAETCGKCLVAIFESVVSQESSAKIFFNRSSCNRCKSGSFDSSLALLTAKREMPSAWALYSIIFRVYRLKVRWHGYL